MTTLAPTKTQKRRVDLSKKKGGTKSVLGKDTISTSDHSNPTTSKPSSPQSCADGGIEEFEAMMELMQQKFKRKSQDQQRKHQLQMEDAIKITLKSLNEQTSLFEKDL